MIRVAVVVEGQTELEFVSKVLAPSLWEREVYLSPMLIGSRGGDVSVDNLASDMVRYLKNFDYVTSLVDFYGFRRKGSATLKELERRITEEIRKKVRRPQIQSRVFAYVQQYEFEGLLFSDVSAFASVLSAPDGCVEELRAIRSSFQSPEYINDSPRTAPSKRIAKVIPRYTKRVDGPLLAETMGLDKIRTECPRFNEWVKRIESLGDAP